MNSSGSAHNKKQLPNAKLIIILSDFSGGAISCLTTFFLAVKVWQCEFSTRCYSLFFCQTWQACKTKHFYFYRWMVHFRTLVVTAMKWGTKIPVKNYPSLCVSKCKRKYLGRSRLRNWCFLRTLIICDVCEAGLVWLPASCESVGRTLLSQWGLSPLEMETFFLLHHTIKLQELQIKWKHSNRAYHLIDFIKLSIG